VPHRAAPSGPGTVAGRRPGPVCEGDIVDAQHVRAGEVEDARAKHAGDHGRVLTLPAHEHGTRQALI